MSGLESIQASATWAFGTPRRRAIALSRSTTVKSEG